MAIQTFAPSAAALAAALRLQSGGAPTPAVDQSAQPATPTFVQAAPATSLPPPVPQESPWLSDYSKNLISSATDVNNPVDHWAEGVGRLTQLASGFYAKSKEEARREQREKAFDAYMDKAHPDLAEAHRYGSAEERARLRDLASKSLVARSEEARKRAQEHKDYTGLRERVLADPNLDPILREIILNPQTSKLGIEGYLEQRKEREKRSIALKEKENEWQRDYERGLKIFNGDERRAMLYAGGVKSPTNMEGLNQAGIGPTGLRLDENGEPRKPIDPLAHMEGYESAPPDQRGAAYRDELAIGRKRSEALSSEEAQSASTIAALDQAERALSRVRTGAFAQQEHIGRKVLAALGVEDADKIASGEVVNALRLQFARGARVGFPGSVTEREMQWYFDSAPGLDKTKEGNMLIIMGMRHNAMKPQYERQDRQEWARARVKAGLPATYGSGFAAWHAEKMRERKAKVKAEMDSAFDALVLKSQETNEGKLLRERGGVQGAPVPLPRTDLQLRGSIYDPPAPTPAPQAPPQPVAPPLEAIEELARNPTPEMRRYFDETFGAGAADRAVGAFR